MDQSFSSQISTIRKEFYTKPLVQKPPNRMLQQKKNTSTYSLWQELYYFNSTYQSAFGPIP